MQAAATPMTTVPCLILALETSTEQCSVALSCRDGSILERTVAASAGHSERLLPMVQALLAEAGLALTDLNAIAYGAGPGAFTGLRLACGVAQGLAFGAALPVVGVGSLEALAWASGQPRVYACVDARMNEVYFAAYHIEGLVVESVLECGVASAALAGIPQGEGWLGLGSGFASYGPALQERLGAHLSAVDAAPVPTAAAVLRLAQARLKQGAGEDAFHAQPAYVRQKVALTTAERLARGGKA